jgi:hypothetical protein
MAHSLYANKENAMTNDAMSAAYEPLGDVYLAWLKARLIAANNRAIRAASA